MEVKLSYNASNFRIRLVLRVAHAHDDSIDLQNFIDKTKGKFELLKDEEKIDIYYIFEKQLKQFWRQLRTVGLDKDRELFFDLGFGAKRCDIKLGPGNKTVLAFIRSFKSTEKTPVTYERFLVNIMCELKGMGLDHLVYDLGIKTAYYHYMRQDLVTPYPMISKKERSAQTAEVSATVNKNLSEGFLYVSSANMFQTTDGLKELYNKAKSFFPKIKAQFPRATFLGAELQKELKEEAAGPASVGIGLPKVFAIAINEKAGKKKAKAISTKLKNPKSSPFKLKVDPTGHEATIELINKANLKKDRTYTDEEWAKILSAHGIKFGFEDPVIAIQSMLKGGKNPTGMVIARGVEARAGLDVFLHPVYLDKDEEEHKDDEDIDIRSMQNRRVVEPGDVIAELRYRDEDVGTDVFGDEVHAVVEESVKRVRVGRNVEFDEAGRIISKIHGMPQIREMRVDCSQIFVHNGDINLSSGNISFEGSVEVNGNIESGAVVTVSENLTVNGTIGQAFIACSGNLFVKRGVVTSMKGLVEVGGKMTADFVENSRLMVRGDLIVAQSVINSDAIVGGKLQIKAPRTGIIGGGHISVREHIITGNLGFEDGRKTICRIGVDWVVERKIAINESRLEKILAALDVDGRKLEDMKKQMGRRLDPRKVAEQEALQKRLDRMNKLRKRLQRRLDNYQTLITWNRDSVIIVNSQLARNVSVMVGGKKIPVTDSIRSIILSYHKLRKGRINPVEYLADLEAKISEKKAS
ncbi:MAG: DUF342 domain-containing protein [Pseudobacteriovorax sp.]|nr:DUF342 domain-containing protein [Pseudobacteriovorax sp.]